MKKWNNIMLHIAFWILFAFLPLSAIFFNDEPLPPSSTLYLVLVYLLHVLNFYAAYYGLVPFMVKRRKILLIIFGSIFFIIVFSLLRLLIIKAIFFNIDMELEENMKKFLSDNSSMFFDYIVQSTVFTGFGFLLRFTFEWFKTQKQKADLINQNQASELALLRNQINPHFLLNTLNNIYSLVYKKDDKAPDAVMKLSEILHYMLYRSNTEKVILDNEIKYLKSFIELQQLRLGNNEFVSFIIHGSTSGRTIAPMLLMPFLENAFKHGDRQTRYPGIIIELKMNPREIEFFCKNYVSSDPNKAKDETGGIGLHNIQRRLELLYPGKYILDINPEKNQFSVYLKIIDK